MTEDGEKKGTPRRAPARTIPKEPGTYPLPGMRKIIAKRLTESVQKSPHFFLTLEIDMEAAAAFRERKKNEGVRFSYNDMIVKAAGLALREHPHVNAYFKDTEVEILERANVGFAVAVEEGLTVPVARDVDKKPLAQLAQETRELSVRAREGKLQLTDLQGGGITVSNLGMFDVENFTAIINPPQSAILAVSAIKKKPVVVDDEIRVGLRMNVTMSSDHRMVDGVLAARYMKTLKDLLEAPEKLA